jgi:alkylated DNA repair dioxygenase AlkB
MAVAEKHEDLLAHAVELAKRKECRRKTYYEEHKEEICERQKKYYGEHKEYYSNYQRKYRMNNKKKFSDYMRERRRRQKFENQLELPFAKDA